MVEGRRERLREREGMVVGRLVAAIEPHEGDRGRAVGKRLHVARNEAEMLGVPG